MKNLKILIIIIFLTIIPLTSLANEKDDLLKKLKGHILLKVETNGEAWYVNPKNENKYYLGRPNDAYKIMREIGLGITENDFAKFQNKAPKNLSGYILLRVQAKGEAYYVDPSSLKLFYLARPNDAFKIMRKFGLGVSNNNLNKIKTNEENKIEKNNSVNKINETNKTSCSIDTFEKKGTYLRTIYISTNGSDDTGNGSATKPYKSLKKVVKEVRPGDIIKLTAGVYQGSNYFTNLQGTELNPIQISGPDTGEAILSGVSEVLHLIKPTYIVLRNIKFQNSEDNGINIDDGGDYDISAHHILLENIKINNIGSGGNNDNLKLSGVRDFFVINSEITDGSSGGSGIDMVGCQNGLIAHNYFYNLGSNFIQTKGGSEKITIQNNYFEKTSQRGINMGGSTGSDYFRPSIASGVNYEARNINVNENVFVDVDSGVAFTGCDSCTAEYNISQNTPAKGGGLMNVVA